MTDATPNNHPMPDHSIEWARYANGRIDVTTSLETIESFNRITLTQTGESLFDLTDRSPNEAYRLIKQLFRAVIVGNELLTVSVDDAIIASKDDSNEQERQQMGALLLESWPNADYQTFDFTVKVRGNADDEALFGADEATTEVLVAHVTPPNLAN